MARHGHALAYGIAGLLLGIGAPVGAGLLRWTLHGVDPGTDVREHFFFYAYELVGSSLVFGVGGFLAGRRSDRLWREGSRYRALAEHDGLTHLPNDRMFHRLYRRVSNRSRNYGEPFALLLVDVDNLKRINDRWGHAVGNEALVRLAEMLRTCKREEDTAARWGGDEFVVLMPGCDQEGARRLAALLVERAREIPLDPPAEGKVMTITIGAAAGTAAEPVDFFEVADRALYEAKTAGRDRYCVVPVRT